MNIKKKVLQSSVSLGALLALALPAATAFAQDTFTINGPTFVTNGGPLAIIDGDDTLIVAAPAGSITVVGVGENAIIATGSNNIIVVEAGTPIPALSASGDGGNGIAVGGLATQVIVGGRIEVSGNTIPGADTATGIGVEGAGSAIELQSTGVIIMSGTGAYGIGLFSDEGRVISDGFIGLSGGGGFGIIGSGDRVTLLNSGTIALGGLVGNSTGMFLSSEDGVVTNIGGIGNAGAGFPSNVIAIDASGARVRVENFGTITQLGDGGRGIRLTADNGSVLNTGLITLAGPLARGIEVNGAGNTISHTGAIATSTVPGADTDAIGIFVIGANNLVSVTGNGEISTSGDNAVGISVGLDGNRVLFDGLLIQTTGNGASGIVGSFGDEIVIETAASNGGEIVTQGLGAYGIYLTATSDRGTVLNGANIFTTGGASGIRNDGDNARIINSGEITTSGLQANGIWNEVNNGTQITNSGFISTSGQTAHGLYSFNSDDIILENTGEILVTGVGSSGIQTFLGTGQTVINSGLIRAEGSADEGILVFADGVSVLNSGEIRTGPGIVGIDVQTDDIFVRNTGRIFSGLGAGDLSFSSAGLNTHLRLDPGSIIVGELEFLAAGATLDVGLPNAAMTWDLAAPDIILSDGRPQLVVGNTLYVFDPAHFAAMDQTAFSVLDQIGFTLDQRPAAPGAGEHSFWVTGNIMGAGDAEAVAGILGTTFAASADRRLGGFIGTQTATFETAFSSSEVESRMTFGGLTWDGDTHWGAFQTALSFGRINHDAVRRVANNTVLTGIEDATASPTSTFLSVSATFGTETEFNGLTVRPSARLRYSWQRTDAFSEVGSQANMTVDARASQRLDLRARIETDLAPWQTGLGDIAITLYGGLDLGFGQGEDISATLAGQPVDFGIEPAGSAVRGFVGAQATFDIRNGATLRLSGELGAGGDNGAEVRLGAMYALRF